MIDAFKVRELNLLIFSFIFRQAHNTFIKMNPNYVPVIDADNTPYMIDYSAGAIAGVIIVGIVADLFFQTRRFLLIFILNIILYCWDIYLFAQRPS